MYMHSRVESSEQLTNSVPHPVSYSRRQQQHANQIRKTKANKQNDNNNKLIIYITKYILLNKVKQTKKEIVFYRSGRLTVRVIYINIKLY
jgi:hypothetical protein